MSTRSGVWGRPWHVLSRHPLKPYGLDVEVASLPWPPESDAQWSLEGNSRFQAFYACLLGGVDRGSSYHAPSFFTKNE